MGDHELPLVQDDVADQLIEEVADLSPELIGLGFELVQGVGQAVRDLDVSSLQLSHELDVVVARQADRRARLGHGHHESEDRGRVWATVAVVTDEDRPAPIGRGDLDAVVGHVIAEFAEQFGQLGVATVDVADHVKRAMLGTAVGPQRSTLDLGRRHLAGRSENPHSPKPLPLQALQGLVQFGALVTDHVPSEVATGPSPVALLADRLWHVEHDRDGEQVVLLGQLDQRTARRTLNVRGIHDREAGLREATTGDELQHGECVGGGRLVVLVIGHQPAAEIRRDHLRRGEMRAGERALAAARGPDQDHEARVGKVDPQRRNTAICVGGPTSASSGPTGRKRTA